MIARCVQCDHQFLVNRKAVGDIVRELYQGLHYWELDRNHQGIFSIDSEQQWAGFLAARWTAIRDNGILVEDGPCPQSVLEIGCSVGNEPNRAVAALGRKALGVPILSCPIEECLFSPVSFDVIISFHTFEHLVDPAAVVRQCGTWLKQGGRFLLELPCDDKEIDNLDHLHFFSPKSAALMLKAIFGNVTIHDNRYATLAGETMASVYVSAQKAG
jgi:SAM-dependent methyltransferase